VAISGQKKNFRSNVSDPSFANDLGEEVRTWYGVVNVTLDPLRAAELYGAPPLVGGYALQDIEFLASYFKNVRPMTSDERGQLEERIIAEGSVFDRTPE
jgi:hypothetical protein